MIRKEPHLKNRSGAEPVSVLRFPEGASDSHRVLHLGVQGLVEATEILILTPVSEGRVFFFTNVNTL